VRSSGDAAVLEQRLELEIYKAIHDRAILGVQVSRVDDGLVYLEGRVASPRQKLAAVRAALSVPGVKEVRNRIVID
jgi:osmotically-inducible protein OsmY